MSPSARFRAGLTGIFVLVAFGATGYVLIEGAQPLDAIYMVMITVTTVGFGEVFSLSTGGQVLTIGIMVVGVGLGFYTAGAGIEQLFILGEGRRATRTRRMIEHMSNHVVLCGFGRVGHGTWEALTRRGISVVVVESDTTMVQHARDLGAIVVEGDGTHNETLLDAGIKKARALVACVTNDADNLVIVLSARSMCPDLHIVSRTSEAESESKLRLAGADRVVAPQVVGSERLAAMAVEQTLTEMFDVIIGGRTLEFAIEEIHIPRTSLLVGMSIREAGIRERSGAMILAVEDTERRLLTTPTPDHVLQGDETVILVGTQDQVDRAQKMIDG